MSSIGRLLRVSILGESHGTCVGALVDGCPAGLPLEEADLAADLARRRAGAPGTTARIEPDVPRIASGVFEGRTTGAPILILIGNEAARPADYEGLSRTPRPGHADLAARLKYGGHADPRGGGHFSGRLTAALVAAGAIARRLIEPVEISARVTQAGGDADAHAAARAAADDRDSIGGIVECTARNVPAGLGGPLFDGVEPLLAHALLSIPGIKGIEFGAGFAAVRMRGSEHNDAITGAGGRTATNHAGGANGGITNGNPLVFRVAVRPAASIGRPQAPVALSTGAGAVVTIGGRHDACIALRVPVVAEAVTAIVLADLMLIEGRLARVLSRKEGSK
jgi:chorismate synthase